MKKIIVDSSSAILLHKCGIFEHLAAHYEIFIPETVFSELTGSGHDGSEFFRGYFTGHRIKSCNTIRTSSLRRGNSLHEGERGVIALFLEGGYDYIIIDDGRGSIFCRDNNIPFINALLAVKVLYLNEYISGQLYTSASEWLVSNGRYSSRILQWAEQAEREALSFFL